MLGPIEPKAEIYDETKKEWVEHTFHEIKKDSIFRMYKDGVVSKDENGNSVFKANADAFSGDGGFNWTIDCAPYTKKL